MVVFEPSWCNVAAWQASAAGGAGHAAEVMVALEKGVTSRISTMAVTLLPFLFGVSAAVQRFTKEPVDLVARLGDTVSGNMSAALFLLTSCQLPLQLSTDSTWQQNKSISFLFGRTSVCKLAKQIVFLWSFGLCAACGPARQPAGLNSCFW